MLTSPSPLPKVAILPSLPPSPSLFDEVFSHPRPWSVRTEQFDLQNSRRPSSGSAGSNAKGKKRQTMGEGEDEDDSDTIQRVSTHETYPPTTDETAETRIVEETLKRWELAERRRRKSHRDSLNRVSGSSFLSNITRTASLVISRSSIGATVGPSNTHTYKSHDTVNVAREGYAVPLDDIENARLSQDVAGHSPSPTPSDTYNPFVHPSERARTQTPLLSPSAPPSPSPFSDARALQAVQGDLAICGSVDSSITGKSAYLPPSLPSPRPLGLPAPGDVPQAMQPQPTSQPVLGPPPRQDPEGRRDVPWWHEWLCGCGEGPDRGGDNQAGRTNPFE